MIKKHSTITQKIARNLYVRGYTISEIKQELGIAERTLQNWRDKERWDKLSPPDSVEIALTRRINLLTEKEVKTAEDLKELDKLCQLLCDNQIKFAKALKLEAEAVAIANFTLEPTLEPDQTPRAASDDKRTYNNGVPRKARKEKPIKNDVSLVTEALLDKVRSELFFDYQKLWYEKKNDEATRRNRFILKSRQIGATFYFAFEALDDAIRTGDNQIFLSASRDQAEVFKAYIIAFAQKYLGIELKGTGVILLSNGAELRFLSTNSNTAQSYHGHLYIDEVFWIPNYRRLNKVASGMAAHKKWRRTKFSTPSAISHEAYGEWSGDLYNKKRSVAQKVDFDVGHEALKNGWLGPDKIWRHMVTVEDAEQQGCNLFDIAELRLEYSDDDFDNLFMCRFIDDSKSVFSLEKLLRCIVDDEKWKDYDDSAAMPYGRRPVALGYDPSRTRDNASLAICGIPMTPKEPWKVLDTKSYHGQNFQFQANRIKEVKNAHNVRHIGIDTTGIGRGVFELVADWFPLAQPIHYSLEMKTQLVNKALDVIENGRLKYLGKHYEITRAFLMITQTTTGSGVITYASSRNTEAGHADIAWSIMHALVYEPINSARKTTTVTFSEAS